MLWVLSSLCFFAKLLKSFFTLKLSVSKCNVGKETSAPKILVHCVYVNIHSITCVWAMIVKQEAIQADQNYVDTNTKISLVHFKSYANKEVSGSIIIIQK